MKKEVIFVKKIINIVKEYAPIHNIEEVEISIPKNYDLNKKNIISLFSSLGVKAVIKENKGGKIKLISIKERF